MVEKKNSRSRISSAEILVRSQKFSQFRPNLFSRQGRVIKMNFHLRESTVVVLFSIENKVRVQSQLSWREHSNLSSVPCLVVVLFNPKPLQVYWCTEVEVTAEREKMGNYYIFGNKVRRPLLKTTSWNLKFKLKRRMFFKIAICVSTKTFKIYR